MYEIKISHMGKNNGHPNLLCENTSNRLLEGFIGSLNFSILIERVCHVYKQCRF